MYELIKYLKTLSLITVIFKSTGFYSSLDCNNFKIENDILIGYHHLDNSKIIFKIDLYKYNDNLTFDYNNNTLEIDYK